MGILHWLLLYSHLYPRMCQYIWSCISLFIVSDKTTLNEMFTLIWNWLKCLILKVKITFNHIMNNFRFILTWKRNFAREHDIQNDSHRPYVNFRIVFLKKYFWGHIIRWSTHCIHGLSLRIVFRQSEVYHLNAWKIIVFEQHQILWFYISMRYRFRM